MSQRSSVPQAASFVSVVLKRDKPEVKAIDVFICKLSKKLANASNGRNFIERLWGRGHVLRDPFEGEALTSA